MIAGITITIREGLEAFLITGILLGYLKKIGRERLTRYVWTGTFAGIGLSVVLALAFRALAIEYEDGAGGALFEAVAAAVAVPILSYTVLWMQRQSRSLKGAIEQQAAAAVSAGHVFGLAFLAFITVFREGLETAVFLTALPAGPAGQSPLAGALLGLLLAAATAYLLFAATIRLSLRRFFIATGILLIFIGAGLCAHIFMALHEMGMPVLVEKVWSTKWLLDSDSLVGHILHAFIGYHDEPNLPQVLAYFGYLGALGAAFWRAIRASARPAIATPAPADAEPAAKAAVSASTR